jgi:pyridoxine 5-phosphate synthase
MTAKLKLGVNIDHVATLRQARGTPYPDVCKAALACEKAGADGITVHLREDRRHIQDDDVFKLRECIKTRMNLEMANSREILDIALEVLPHEVCLVPEKREELTTEGGLDVAGLFDELTPTVQALSEAGVVASMFVDPEIHQLDACAKVGAPYVELHTGAYCNATGAKAEAELQRLVDGSRHAHSLGINVNAGHGINMDTIDAIMRIPHLDTLNIGHSIVARAVLLGLEQAVREMTEAMQHYGNSKA